MTQSHLMILRLGAMRYAMADGIRDSGRIYLALRGTEEGGFGRAAEFYGWCERATGEFLA